LDKIKIIKKPQVTSRCLEKSLVHEKKMQDVKMSRAKQQGGRSATHNPETRGGVRITMSADLLLGVMGVWFSV
jgi:hypothetical protein